MLVLLLSVAFAAELRLEEGVLSVDGKRWEGGTVLAALEHNGQIYLLREDESLELRSLEGALLGVLPSPGGELRPGSEHRRQVPVGIRTDIVGSFTTTGSGVLAAEGGVSTWLRGNGDRDSLGLRVGAGYGSQQSLFGGRRELAGPMVSVGIRYRR